MSAKRKKIILKAQSTLEDIMNKLEMKRKPDRNLKLLASSLTSFLLKKQKGLFFFYAKHKFFEHGSKPGRLLVHLARFFFVWFDKKALLSLSADAGATLRSLLTLHMKLL